MTGQNAPMKMLVMPVMLIRHRGKAERSDIGERRRYWARWYA
jgi:hypothetical protein